MNERTNTIPVEIEPRIPKDEISARSQGNELGRIINVGSAHTQSYEEQLATVESMMTDYDTPLTQAAGYVRDLLRTIIALKKRERPATDGAIVERLAIGLCQYHMDKMPPHISKDFAWPRGASPETKKQFIDMAALSLEILKYAAPKNPGERAKTKSLLDVIRMKLERRFQVSDYLMDGFREDPPARAVVTDICQDVMAHVREIHALAERALKSVEDRVTKMNRPTLLQLSIFNGLCGFAVGESWFLVPILLFAVYAGWNVKHNNSKDSHS